jgi:hypothetical protein
MTAIAEARCPSYAGILGNRPACRILTLFPQCMTIMVRARFALLLLIAFAANPAGAAEVTYPPASRIGMVPPPGLHVSAAFPGFEDRATNVAILITAMRPSAFADFENSDSSEFLKHQGAVLEKREVLDLPIGRAVLVIGHDIDAPNADAKATPKGHTWLLAVPTPELTALVTVRIPDAARDAYPDAAIRAAFATLTVRAEVPVDEQLGLLPFKVTELAGFKVGGIFPGRALVLTDVAGAAAEKAIEPRLSVTLLPGSTTEAGDRDEVARMIFRTIPGIKDVRITESQSLRLSNQQVHELMAVAKDAETSADISLVQWLRFGTGASLHIFGLAPTAAWAKAYTRFRSVRDGIEPR